MNLTAYFEKGIENNESCREALKIVRDNSLGGNIWLIGGAVFRSIVKSLYKTTPEDLFDFDFIVEKPVALETFNLPTTWEITKTFHGSPRFLRNREQIDFVPINNAVGPSDKDKIPTMTNQEKIMSYFRQVPLTVQAIAYDFNTKQVIGDVGIESIIRKECKVNNFFSCVDICRRKKISVNIFVSTKAVSLGFQPIFPTIADEQRFESRLDFKYFTIRRTTRRTNQDLTCYPKRRIKHRRQN